jgi:hypothetical protein
MKPMGKSLAAAVVVALVTGCNYGAASFHCEADQQCGAGGRCETSSGGLCSFRDDSCPSGYRFGELAGGSSNRCVGEQPTDAGVDVAIDAAPDAPPDAPPDAQACFGGTFLTVCLQSAPAAARTISTPETINTDDMGMCTATLSITPAGNYCVIAATDITVNAKLRAIGMRPLVLLASGSITTMAGGLIDVGSHRITPGGTTEKGAGADSTACATGNPPAGAGGGGGAGGSFLGHGGVGGTGGNGGAGGMPAPEIASVTVVRGGCAGQEGQGSTGQAGSGGGAVYLIAGVRIDIQGGINAAGEGGGGGAQNVGGGSGGGSGGMIGFDAPMITCNSLLLASGAGGGGGGGSGGGDTTGGTAPDPAATGASNGGAGFNGNNTFGGAGGMGSPVSTHAFGGGGGVGDNGGTNHGGGGGGGGGTGLIKAPDTANLGGNLSPPRTP